jgi:hypothetical protein
MADLKHSDPVNRKKPNSSVETNSSMELRVALTGDQRVAEDLILEVREIAQRFGLEIPNIQVLRQPKIAPKTIRTKVRSRRDVA